MIFIVNKKDEVQGEYCGRPSVLGNPYPLTMFDRDKACDLYDEWLHHEIEVGNRPLLKELYRLSYILKSKGELTLSCWCVPNRCHCESIKKVLLNGNYKSS